MKVECISNEDSDLTIGKSYEIIKKGINGYWVIDDMDIKTWYHTYLFKPVCKCNKNKKIKCVNKENNSYLTVGKTYDVIETDGQCCKITNDNGIDQYYSKEYFKAISESKNEKVECVKNNENNNSRYDLAISKNNDIISENEHSDGIDLVGLWDKKDLIKTISESKNRKVECIKTNEDNNSRYDLTIGKTYGVIIEDINYYWIINDYNNLFYYDKKYFKHNLKQKNMKVECVNKENNSYLTVGKTYDVIETDGQCCKITNDNGIDQYYSKEYFKAISESKNEKVECIGNNENSYNLTIGKTYEITKTDENCYLIIDDNDHVYWYHKDLFKHDIQKMDTQEGVSKLNETPLTEEHKITWKYHLKDFVEHLRCVEMRNYIHENNRKNSELLNAICDKFKGGEVGIHFLLSGHRNFDEIVKEAYHNYLYSIFYSPIKRSFKFMKWSDLDDILQEDDELEVKIFRIILKEKHEYGSIYYDFDKTLSEKVTDLVNTTEKKSCVSPNEDKVASMFSELTGKEISSDEVVMLLSLAKMVKELINK